jgi:positive regulator of sigma E activity
MRCACCGVASTGARTIEVPRGDLEEGERVCVSVPLYAGYLSTLVVFVLPIVLALAGGVVGWVLEGRTTAHDLSIIVGGLCGFAVAVAVAALVNRRLSSEANLEVHRLDGHKT